MAEDHEGDHRLIEQYLADLRRSLGDRADGDAVVDELRDHLLASAEHHQRSGSSPAEAARAAVDEFGDPEVVAASFRRSDRGRPAVPTLFTRTAGITGFVAAGAGLVAAGAFAIGDRVEASDGYWSTESQAWGAFGSVATLLATMCLALLLAGTVRRHGGLGAAGTAATALATLGAAASVIAWAVPVWGMLVAASWIVLAVATRDRGLAPRRAIPALATALPVIPLVSLATDGGPTALLLAADIVALGVAAGGAIALGRWLAAEEPVATARPLAAA